MVAAYHKRLTSPDTAARDAAVSRPCLLYCSVLTSIEPSTKNYHGSTGQHCGDVIGQGMVELGALSRLQQNQQLASLEWHSVAAD